MKGSKNSERRFISPEVTNLKNITTKQELCQVIQKWSRKLHEFKVTHYSRIWTDLDSLLQAHHD